MRLEDAFLHLVMPVDAASAPAAAEHCSAAIGVGVDAIHLDLADDLDDVDSVLELFGQVCRRDDALLFVMQNLSLVSADAVDGVNLRGGLDSIGLARAMGGPDSYVGVTTETLEEAQVAVELGVDYLVHRAGSGCPSVFSALGPFSGVPFVAGGFRSIADAREVVELGVIRLAIEPTLAEGGDVVDVASEFSRMIGRCI